MTELTIKAREITAWRGWRGTGDLMAGIFVLQIRPADHHALINITGTIEELDELKHTLISALESESW